MTSHPVPYVIDSPLTCGCSESEFQAAVDKVTEEALEQQGILQMEVEQLKDQLSTERQSVAQMTKVVEEYGTAMNSMIQEVCGGVGGGG